MKLRNFKSLSVTSSESLRLFESIKVLLLSQNNSVVSLYKEIDSIQQLACDSQIKYGNWGIRILINGTGKSCKEISHDLFIKQTSESSYCQERKGISNLKSSGLDDFPNILCPIDFFEDKRIIVSVYFDGHTFKRNLRKCLFTFNYRDTQADFLTSCNAIGQWLFSFHNETMSRGNSTENENLNSHELKNFLFPTEQKVLQNHIDTKEIIDEMKLALDNKLGTSFIPCTIHGDFGVQNILIRNSKFKIIDWEHSHYGHPFNDCITYIVSILDQSKFAPFNSAFITNAINSFIDSYLYQCPKSDKRLIKSLLVILAAHHTIKRDEWASKKEKTHHFFIFNRKFLIELISNTYRTYKKIDM